MCLFRSQTDIENILSYLGENLKCEHWWAILSEIN